MKAKKSPPPAGAPIHLDGWDAALRRHKDELREHFSDPTFQQLGGDILGPETMKQLNERFDTILGPPRKKGAKK